MSDQANPTLPLRAAYEFAALHGLEAEIRAIREMEVEWDRSTSGLRRGFVVALFEGKGLWALFTQERWPAGATPAGERKRRYYLRLKKQYEDFLAGREPETEERGGDEGLGETEEQTVEFALEGHLRQFLARNPEKIEAGLRLYSSGERDGEEFPIDGGRIDLLGMDREGKYVVIELKLSQGRNRTLGQILYYMAWVDRNLGNGPCRGYIIASEIGEELKLAAALVPQVRLAEYRMSFSIEPVGASER